MQWSERLHLYVSMLYFYASNILFGSLEEGLATNRRAWCSYTGVLQADKKEQMLGLAVSHQGRG